MMKKIYLLPIVFFSCTIINAQSIDHQVVASGGDFISSPTGSVAYTVGEAVTTTITGGGHTVTQGFQQPVDALVGLLEVEKEAFGAFSVYPVPATDKLWFGYEFPEGGVVKVEIYDVLGQKLDYNFSESYDTGKAIHTLDCTQYAAANYLISASITTKNNEVKTISRKFAVIH